MKMIKGNKEGIVIESIKHLRKTLEERGYEDVKIMITDNCVIIHNYSYNCFEIPEKETYGRVFFSGHGTIFHTGTAKKIINQYKIKTEENTFYICDRKKNRLVGEKITEVIDPSGIVFLKSPFDIEIEKIKDLRFNQFLKNHTILKERLK